MKFFICFSFLTNIRQLFSGKHAKGSFTALHGIRAISSTWIVLYHIFYLYGVIGGIYEY